MSDYKYKYQKYKAKFLTLQNQKGGREKENIEIVDGKKYKKISGYKLWNRLNNIRDELIKNNIFVIDNNCCPICDITRNPNCEKEYAINWIAGEMNITVKSEIANIPKIYSFITYSLSGCPDREIDYNFDYELTDDNEIIEKNSKFYFEYNVLEKDKQIIIKTFKKYFNDAFHWEEDKKLMYVQWTINNDRIEF